MPRDRCFAFIVLHGARVSGSWLSIWNEGGEFWCEAPASWDELIPSLVDYTLEIAVRSTPTAASNTARQSHSSKRARRANAIS
ncbi:MAG: hypothetical protein JWM16_1441 [Verrucomicrobiales bacterium]|nr:hypothetical protein [Verrucomicrobiales bacterium]